MDEASILKAYVEIIEFPVLFRPPRRSPELPIQLDVWKTVPSTTDAAPKSVAALWRNGLDSEHLAVAATIDGIVCSAAKRVLDPSG